jgi:putative chitinase
MITKYDFDRMITGASIKNLNLFYQPLISGMQVYQINTSQRIAMFMANVLHESGSFRYVREIASGEAYEGRKDLGNVVTGDGVRFKGRGLIQITGRANYASISQAFGVDFLSAPELLEQPEWAAKSACWWWNKYGCNKLADTGVFEKTVRRVNGGLNGIEDRKKHLAQIIKVLGT